MLRSIYIFLLTKLRLGQFGVLIGYIRKSGWISSLWRKKAIDGSGKPIPWFTYCFIHFLEHRLDSLQHRNMRVFEFGSGNSTLWWAKRVTCIFSVEDNADWYSYVSANKPDNVNYKFGEDEKSYISTLISEPELFDIIVIDGSHRDRCVRESLRKLNHDGVLIIDNSDWDGIKPAIDFLIENGFRQLEFYGIGPANGHPWGTSVFYKKENLFGL